MVMGLVVLWLMGCSSSEKTYPGLEENDGGSKARGPAYVTDHFNVRKPMPRNDKWEAMEFYHKHCSKMDEPVIHFPNKFNYECESRF